MPDDKRPRTSADRDYQRPKTSPFGHKIPEPPESWEGSDSYTPIADQLPDVIEATAAKIEQRAEAIRDRPGPTPPPEALQSALTIHGVRGELHELKRDVGKQFEVVHKKIEKVAEKVEGVAEVVVKGMSDELDRRRDAEHLIMRGKLEVGTAGELAKIDVDAAKAKAVESERMSAAIAKLEIDAAKQKARIERRNKILLTILGVVVFLLEARHC